MTEQLKIQLRDLYKKYDLTTEDVFKHQHYTIITRAGIDKIQSKAKIEIKYKVVTCVSNFAAVKAKATLGENYIETFGSALYGRQGQGNSNTHYILEMAEKRAMSRAVLKLTGFYEVGHFGQEESESFVKSKGVGADSTLKDLIQETLS